MRLLIEVLLFEVHKVNVGRVREFKVATDGHVGLDAFVKFDDPDVDTLLLSCKGGVYVSTIDLEFLSPVFENKDDGLSCNILRNDPVPVCAHCACGDCFAAGDEFKLHKTQSSVVWDDNVISGENFVKVNCPSGEDVVPFAIGNWGTLARDDVCLDLFEAFLSDCSKSLSGTQRRSKRYDTGLPSFCPGHEGERALGVFCGLHPAVFPKSALSNTPSSFVSVQPRGPILLRIL